MNNLIQSDRCNFSNTYWKITVKLNLLTDGDTCCRIATTYIYFKTDR